MATGRVGFGTVLGTWLAALAALVLLVLAPVASAQPGSLNGACCLTSPNGGVFCVIRTEAQCAEQGGQWRGVGTTCDPNPCNSTPPPTVYP